ncbi:hypothetical protein [Serratia fonticola]|uniref:Uncharacterized protein n=1 Tax=Serratia fonticola TaxID=47917 RepID=A0ABY9PV19_SERFO|nr:hypothetical protein [Serratia fonticola]WMT17334.1 hypothetical protein RFB13_10645 [Serratia fonticola]
MFLRRVDDGTSAMARHQGSHDGYTQAGSKKCFG